MLEYFGQIGGFIDFIHITAYIMTFVLCKNIIDAKSVNVFYKCHLSDEIDKANSTKSKSEQDSDNSDGCCSI